LYAGTNVKQQKLNFIQCLESHALFDYGRSLGNIPLVKFKSFEDEYKETKRIVDGYSA
jgi:hypothetical protein